MIKVTPKELTFIREYVESNCGIALDSSKSYLVESRLGPILQEEGTANYVELIVKASKDRTGRLKHKIIDSITTNETYFFRDQKPYELLAHKLIPDLLEKQLDQQKPRVRIWSAAASTGQEVYSISMVLKELLGNFYNHDLRILGTDISEHALSIASRGLYGKVELSRGLNGTRLHKHFTPKDSLWQINEDLRSISVFKQLNLLNGTQNISLQDIIFCRNVAFYFSKPNKEKLFQQLGEKLPVGGTLVIGSTESLVGINTPFEKQQFHGNFFYKRV